MLIFIKDNKYFMIWKKINLYPPCVLSSHFYFKSLIRGHGGIIVSLSFFKMLYFSLFLMSLLSVPRTLSYLPSTYVFHLAPFNKNKTGWKYGYQYRQRTVTGNDCSNSAKDKTSASSPSVVGIFIFWLILGIAVRWGLPMKRCHLSKHRQNWMCGNVK